MLRARSSFPLSFFPFLRIYSSSHVAITPYSSLVKLNALNRSFSFGNQSLFFSRSFSLGQWKPPARGVPGTDGYEEISKIRNVAIIAHVDHGMEVVA